jgi:hypothetical protein
LALRTTGPRHSDYLRVLGGGKLGRDLDELTRAVNGVIARRVEAERTKLGLSLRALAQASGVALSTLESLELRRTGCSAIQLWRISLALGVSISALCEPGPDRAPFEALRRIREGAPTPSRPKHIH